MSGNGSTRESRAGRGIGERRQRILEAFREYETKYGRPPTVREVGQYVGLRSPGATAYQIRRLEELGFLEKVGEGARGRRLSEKGRQEVAAPEPTRALPGRVRTTQPIPASGTARTVALPLLGFIQAGQPIPAPGSGMVSDNPFPDETVLVPVDLIKQADDLFALQVKGDSMVDALVADGDYVILRKQETADPGDMVAVWLEDDVTTTLKFIYPRDGGEVELRPANPRYDSIVKQEDVVRISGKVVAVLRSLEGVGTQRKG